MTRAWLVREVDGNSGMLVADGSHPILAFEREFQVRDSSMMLSMCAP